MFLFRVTAAIIRIVSNICIREKSIWTESPPVRGHVGYCFHHKDALYTEHIQAYQITGELSINNLYAG
jgi:hypothetical protein